PAAADREEFRQVPDCLRRKSSPERRRRKRNYQENIPCEKSAPQSGACRFSRRLQHGTRRKNYIGRGLVVEHPTISAGSFRNERNESRAKRRAELKYSGWLVGGRAHRRRDGLGDWRIEKVGAFRCDRQSCRSGIALFQVGKRDFAAVL